MSQATHVTSGNQDGANFVAQLNAALAALLTLSSGAAAPAPASQPQPYQLWADTTTGTLKIRNAANTAWITLGPLAGLAGNARPENLSITHAPGGATMTSVTVAADRIAVQGTVITGLSETLGTAAGNGAGKLDTGSWATSTWYAVHVICNEDGSLVDVLASLSATAPTLPGGYTRFRRVGWLRTDSSTATNLKATQQFGDRARYVTETQRALSNVAGSTTPATLSLSAFVPPGTRLCSLTGHIGPGLTAGINLVVQQGSSSMSSGGMVVVSNPTSSASYTSGNLADVPLDSAQALRWYTSVASANGIFLDVTGWVDPLS